MDKNHYILIAGSGETSRANIESLLEDNIYASGGNVVFVLAYNKNPNQGHKFVAQLAKDKVKDVIIFANSDANFEGIYSVTYTESADPVKDAAEFLKGKKSSAYILWNDDDERCLTMVNVCCEAGVKCYNLTEGLVPLGPTEPIEAPNIPPSEMVPEEEVEEEYEDEDDTLDDEDEEEPDLDDDIYFGVQALIKAIAKAVVAEIQDASKTDLKAPEK
jgi:hypothetical protein